MAPILYASCLEITRRKSIPMELLPRFSFAHRKTSAPRVLSRFSLFVNSMCAEDALSGGFRAIRYVFSFFFSPNFPFRLNPGEKSPLRGWITLCAPISAVRFFYRLHKLDQDQRKKRTVRFIFCRKIRLL